MAGWGIGGSVELLLWAGPKSVRSGNGRPLIALRCLLMMLMCLLQGKQCTEQVVNRQGTTSIIYHRH